jgi:uncharacterized protein (DUF1499 family)
MDGFTKWLWLAPLLMVSCAGTRPPNLGVRDGRLAPCPKSPNCVSTDSTDEKHRMDPLVYATSLAEARDRLVEVLQGMPRTRVITLDPDYIHAECRSRLFGFTDDVEFLLDDANKTVHFRSASRKGYSDLGVNRKRMEQIRERFSLEKQSR